MTSYLSDFRVGLRAFAKSPGDVCLAVLAYSLGLGLVGLILALIFGVVRGHPEDIDFDELRILTWDESTRHLWRSGSQSTSIRYPDFSEIAARQEVFAAMAASQDISLNVLINRHAQRVEGHIVTPEFFNLFQQRPLLGRFFLPEADGANSERKAVVSHDFWQNQLAGRETVVGESIVIDGAPTTIIGVASEGFDMPANIHIWLNETRDPLEVDRSEGTSLIVWTRLKPDVSPATAIAALNPIAKSLAEAHPETNTGYIAVDLSPLSSMYIGEDLQAVMYLMLVCALLVLLIACTNVANLTLARATTRVRELAIRASLGGTRARLVAQMLAEGFAIALFGGLGGMIIAIWIGRAVWSWTTSVETNRVPQWMNMDVDAPVLLALFAATLGASVVASITPALQASRADVNELLKDQSRGSSGLRIGRFSRFLAFLQLAVSCGLLIATFALVDTSRETAEVELPYDPSQMLTARFDLPPERYAGASAYEFMQLLKQRLEEAGAVNEVGFTSSVDMIFNWGARWEVRGQERADLDDYVRGRHEIVSDNFFELLDVPLVEGRGFEPMDAGENAQQVCIVNTFFARLIQPAGRDSVLGMQIRDTWSENNDWLTIVGVAPDTSMAGPGLTSDEERAGVYRPMSNAPQSSVTIFARSQGDPLAQAPHIRQTLAQLDDSIALYRVRPVKQAIKDYNFGPLFIRNMFGMFGIAALSLASVGIYGVMDFSVRQRVQEFGIRRALGATESAILAIVARMGSIQIIAGIAAGAFFGFALITLLGQSTIGIVVNAASYLVPILTIATISWIALYAPTRYANSAELSQCLRDE